MIAQIIPIIRLPQGSTFYDYEIPEELEKETTPGCLVTIKFRNKSVSGLVYEVVKDSKFKKLNSIQKVQSAPLVSDWHFFLMKWFCEFYQVSWSNFFYTFLPLKPKRKLEEKDYKHELQITQNYKALQEKIDFSEKPGNNLIMFDNKAQRNFYLSKTTADNIKNKTVVIFFPTVDDITLFYNSLSQNIQKDVLIISGKLNKTQAHNTWNKILNKNNIVLSTRLGGFFPYPEDTVFIIDQSENIGFKQTDLNPRYSLLDVLQKRSEYYKNSNINYISLAPKIEHYTLAQVKKINLINKQNLLKNINFLDISNVTYEKSPLLNDVLYKKLENKKRILLYLNRKGDFTVFKCNDCGFIANCEVCKNPFKFHFKEQKLKCHYCLLEKHIPNSCPKCHGQKLLGVGTGTKNIEKILKEKFVNHNIIRLDSDNEDKINIKEPFIIIGTEYILNKLNFDNLDSLIFLNADLDLIFQDFRAQENTWQKCINLVRSVSKDCEVLFQTHDINNQFLENIRLSYHDFWASEIPIRKKYHYPPYYKLLKLIYANQDAAKIENEVNNVYKKIKYQNPNLEILPPQKTNPFKIHRRFYMYILIKYKKEKLDSVFKNLDNNWLIDHNPENL